MQGIVISGIAILAIIQIVGFIKITQAIHEIYEPREKGY